MAVHLDHRADRQIRQSSRPNRQKHLSGWMPHAISTAVGGRPQTQICIYTGVVVYLPGRLANGPKLILATHAKTVPFSSGTNFGGFSIAKKGGGTRFQIMAQAGMCPGIYRNRSIGSPSPPVFSGWRTQKKNVVEELWRGRVGYCSPQRGRTG